MPYLVEQTSISSLSTEEEKQTTAKHLLIIIKQALQKVLNLDSSDLEPYKLTQRNPRSGLTGKGGVYIVLNNSTNDFYIGSSSSLAQRKGDTSRNYKDPARRGQRSVVNPAVRQALENGSLDNFYFIPLVAFNTAGFEAAELQHFLDLSVESVFIKYCMDTAELANRLYNERPVGTFQVGNQFGGTPQSGVPDNAVGLPHPNNSGEYLCVWESVQGAARSLGTSNKTIRNRRDNSKLKPIESSFYASFSGTKISNEEAATFFAENPELGAKVRLSLKLESGQRGRGRPRGS